MPKVFAMILTAESASWVALGQRPRDEKVVDPARKQAAVGKGPIAAPVEYRIGALTNRESQRVRVMFAESAFWGR